MEEERKKAIVLILIGLFFTLSLAVMLNRSEWARMRSDIFARWYATTKLLEEGRSLYDPQNGADVVRLAGNPTDASEGAFYYPAHLLIFTVPLALLDYPAAHLVWTILTQWFLYIGIWVVYKQVGWPENINKFTLFLVFVAVFIPTIQHAIWSQFNTIGVLFLGLCYLALRRGKFGLAGACAAGLTFKPQALIFPLVFFLIWALFEQRRWHFYLGFGLTMFGLWAFAEVLQPGWLMDFFYAIRQYQNIPGYQVVSALDKLWNPYQIISITLIMLLVWMTVRFRRDAPEQPPFNALLVLSMSVGWLVVPIVGMYHLVALPLALILLFYTLQQSDVSTYRLGLVIFILAYFLGLIGFVYGLSRPELYGLHIELAELVYKAIIPMLLTAFSLALLFPFLRKTAPGISR